MDDNGREFRGFDAIKEWSEREIFAAEVTLEVIDAVVHRGARSSSSILNPRDAKEIAIPEPTTK